MLGMGMGSGDGWLVETCHAGLKPKSAVWSASNLWGGSKGVVNLTWVFMQYGVLSMLGTSVIYPGTYSLGLFAGLFSDAMGYCLPIVLCEMTRTK